MKYVVLVIVSVCLLFFIGEPVIAQMGGPMGGQQMGMRGKASDMMEQGKNIRTQQGMHGLGFMHSAGNAYGEYVTFSVESMTGNVLHYGIAGNPLFNISIANFNYQTTRELGSVTWITGSGGAVVVKLHDNPAAVINILTNRSISVTFSLADGVTAVQEGNMVMITSGSINGYISGVGTVTSSVSANQVRVEASPESVVVFRTAPINMPVFDYMHRRFSQEIARNRLGMEVAFGRNGTLNAVNYSETMRLMVRAMERDRIRLLINSTDPAGRVMAFNLDNSSLAIGPGQRLRIHYDGTPLQCVNDPNMVFNGTDRPLCWISPIQDRVRAQVMVYIPNFSERTIDIVVEPEATGTPTANVTMTTPAPGMTPAAAGFGATISLAGILAGAYLMMRRKTS